MKKLPYAWFVLPAALAWAGASMAAIDGPLPPLSPPSVSIPIATPPLVAQHTILDGGGRLVGPVLEDGVQVTVNNVTLFLQLERNPGTTGLSSTELRWRHDAPTYYGSADCSGTPLVTDGHGGKTRDIYRPARIVRSGNAVQLFVAAPGNSTAVAAGSVFDGKSCVATPDSTTVKAWPLFFQVDLGTLYPEPLHIQ